MSYKFTLRTNYQFIQDWSALILNSLKDSWCVWIFNRRYRYKIKLHIMQDVSQFSLAFGRLLKNMCYQYSNKVDFAKWLQVLFHKCVIPRSDTRSHYKKYRHLKNFIHKKWHLQVHKKLTAKFRICEKRICHESSPKNSYKIRTAASNE